MAVRTLLLQYRVSRVSIAILHYTFPEPWHHPTVLIHRLPRPCHELRDTMPPSYSTKQTGFVDERRRSSGYNGGSDNYQSYRPQDRDRGRDLARNGDKSLSWRESDPRDYRDDRDRSHDRERDRVKTRDDSLQLNTNVPTGPRIPSSSAKSSPMTARVNAPPSSRASITSK